MNYNNIQIDKKKINRAVGWCIRKIDGAKVGEENPENGKNRCVAVKNNDDEDDDDVCSEEEEHRN